ncbi:MAG: DUF2007 domain-containing protein [Phycisphaerales bacterium]|nr:DUF2007 domain-containing protein [Phycisphaerales bacterium]
MSNKNPREKYVAVEQCKSAFAAHALVALLKDYDIKATVSNTGSQRLTGNIQSYSGSPQQTIPVLVPESQFELARLTIQDAREDAAEIDWDQVDLGSRTDDLPLTSIPIQPPGWLRVVAIGGLILLGLTILGFVIFFMF